VLCPGYASDEHDRGCHHDPGDWLAQKQCCQHESEERLKELQLAYAGDAAESKPAIPEDKPTIMLKTDT